MASPDDKAVVAIFALRRTIENVSTPVLPAAPTPAHRVRL
jgi:hypothetical protein